MKNMNAVILQVLSVVVAVFGQFSGGSGTVDDPFQITTVTELDSIRYHLKSSFILMNDLNFDGTGYDSTHSTNNEGWVPIGKSGSTSATEFSGIFNGNNHEIANLYINRPEANGVGLFGVVKNGTVCNTRIVDCHVIGNYAVGGLAGVASKNLYNNYATGRVTGNETTGGLIGIIRTNCQVHCCYANITVTVNGNGSGIGGLIGYADTSADIINSYAAGHISGTGYYIGGLIGAGNQHVVVENCYSLCSFSGNYNRGGLIGGGRYTAPFVDSAQEISVRNCYWDKDVSGTDTSYKGTGKTTGEMKQAATFSNWDFDSIWTISDNTYPRLRQVYNVPVFISYPECNQEKGSSFSYTFVAEGMDNRQLEYSVLNAPADMIVNGTALSLNCNTYGTFDIALSATDNNGKAVIQYFSINVTSYAGSGTQADPFRIATIEELDQIRQMPDRYYILQNDLDFSNTEFDSANSTEHKGWEPIGTTLNQFVGSFDGNGHEIKNLYINRPAEKSVGLFGYSVTAQFHNVIITGCNISGESDVGGLTGYLYDGVVDNCANSGIMCGDTNVGGLLGWLHSGKVSESYTNVNVITGDSASACGGLVGFNDNGKIQTSHSTGDISGGGYAIGGLVGIDHGDIKECYATGDVHGKNYVGGLIGTVEMVSNVVKSYAAGVVTGEEYVGGVAGYADAADIIECYASGNVNGTSYTGGLIGCIDNGTLEKCFATGQVVARNKYSGGLVGYNQSIIMNCYAAGKISSTGLYSGGLVGYNSNSIRYCYAIGMVEGADSAGGLVGKNGYNCTVNSSFWDLTNSRINSSDGGTGKSADEMKSLITYTDTAISGLGSPWDLDSVWGIRPDINDGYPFLCWKYGIYNHIIQKLTRDHGNLNNINVNYNPTKPCIYISLILYQNTAVSVKLYDLNGREIKSLLNKNLPAGNHTLRIRTCLRPQVYICKVIAGDAGYIRRVVLNR